MLENASCTFPLLTSGDAAPEARRRPSRRLEPGGELDLSAGEVRRVPDPRGCEVELAGIRLGIGDKLENRLPRQRQRPDDPRRRGADNRNRLQSLEQIVGNI